MSEATATRTTAMKKRKERAYAEHQPKWQRFQTTLMKPATKTAAASIGSAKPTLHPYQRQYAHVYHQRLEALKPRCWEAIDAAALSNTNDDMKGDAPAARMERILELRENVKSLLVGTIVKEGGTTSAGGDTLHPDSRCRPGQSIFVEDESGRANLTVENVHDFCTGMVLGLQGTVGADGLLVVEQVFYPVLPPHPTITASSKAAEKSTEDDDKETTLQPHLLMISGLNCGDPNVSPLRRDNILSYLRGHFGGDSAATVAHVVIAGGSTTGHDEYPTVGIKELDAFCYQVCLAGLPVDILPGKEDPTTANWPQRPLHKSLLKQSDNKMHALLSRVPNPYGAIFNDKFVLGSDGTNVTDLSQSLLTKSTAHNAQDGSEDDHAGLVPFTHLQSLRRTLQCGHMCPTGPDTVPTMPHPESDPMVLPALETPHIYFAGNCDAFETELFEDDKQKDLKVRLICLPKFAATGEAVLVNLETLEAKSIHFPDPPN